MPDSNHAYVWVVMEVDHDYWSVLGVFTTKARAQDAAKAAKAKTTWRHRPFAYRFQRHAVNEV